MSHRFTQHSNFELVRAFGVQALMVLVADAPEAAEPAGRLGQIG